MGECVCTCYIISVLFLHTYVYLPASHRGGLASSPEICVGQTSNGTGYLLLHPLPFHQRFYAHLESGTGIKGPVVAGVPHGYIVTPSQESNNKNIEERKESYCKI
jgi:hypothetical protein